MLRFYFVLFSFFSCVNFTSCSVSDRFVYEDTEGVVDRNFFDSVRRNKTEKNWIRQQLGSPLVSHELDGGSELWTYRLSKSRYNRVRALFVFSYSAVEEKSEYYHLVFCNNLLSKSWFDKFESVQSTDLKSSKCKSKMNSAETNTSTLKDDMDLPYAGS